MMTVHMWVRAVGREEMWSAGAERLIPGHEACRGYSPLVPSGAICNGTSPGAHCGLNAQMKVFSPSIGCSYQSQQMKLIKPNVWADFVKWAPFPHILSFSKKVSLFLLPWVNWMCLHIECENMATEGHTWEYWIQIRRFLLLPVGRCHHTLSYTT